MTLFTADKEKCKRDGICAAVCPIQIIEIRDESPVPTPVEGADTMCIECGHCVAVCPHGAMSHRSMSPDQCPEIVSELQPNAEQTEQFLRARRSIRTFRDKPVEKEILAKLVDLARYAPSGMNRQPVEWLVIRDKNEVREMAGMVVDWMRFLLNDKPDLAGAMGMDRIVDAWESGEDRILRGAPHLIVSHTDQADISASQSNTIAMTYLELAAQTFGVGACWAGYFLGASNTWPPLKKKLGLPDGNGCFGAMMVGYPKFEYKRLPLRKEPRITWR